MSTKEEQDILRRLVQHVSRAFFESATVVAMDQLARHTVLKEDDLAGRIGMQSKDLHKVMAKLTKPGLVKEHRQNELKEGAQRSSSKSYYYIDYTHFCNVVKWRVAEMRRTVDNTLRNELANKGYMCPQCKKTFTALDVAFLHDPMRNGLFCDVCHMEVVNNEDAEAVRGSKDRMERFNRQMRFITAGLRASEGMVMPHLDVATFVKQHLVQSEAERQEKLGGGQAAAGGAGGGKGDGELRIAGANGSGIKEEGISIVMSGGIDEERARAERDKAAEAKKVQNALPAWHLQSTITGDLTALGVAEQARAAAAAAQSAAQAASSSGDDALRGLGTVNGRLGETKMESMISMSEDVKVGTDSAPDYYDNYYASLVAGDQSRSTPTSGVPDDYSRDEEEDVKPNVQILDSLGDYRKRARSPSAHEDEPPAKKFSQDAGLAPTPMAVDEPAAAQEDEDDPTVYVNGEAMPYSSVTEEHHDLMTPDEYTAYFEIASTRM